MDNSRYEVYIGKVLDGRYKILELVGVGGMAFVLKAEDLVMNRIVAIKILNEEFNGDTQAEQRFINESKAVAMLSHKNIVNIYDVAIYPDMKYIVMEFLDGITLKEYLTNKGSLRWKEACYYIGQILRALEHAHGKGVIHRDIKPQNIILLKNGDIKVTDFGIAKLPTSAPLTMTDKAIGTVYYISPEQASGKTTDFYSDIYSVGVMLYECVTGNLPFVATSPVTVAMMQINDQPKSPSEIKPELPAGLVQIILKAMEKDPEKRFRSAHSMLRAIEKVVQDPEFVFVPGETVIDEAKTGEVETESDELHMENYVPELDAKLPSKENEEGQLPDGAVLVKRKKKRKKHERSGLLPVIAGVTFAFILVGLVAGIIVGARVLKAYGEDASDTGITIIIPSLVGSVYSDTLEAELETQNIRVFKKNYVYNTDYGDNVIISQSPEGLSARKIAGEDQYVDITLEISLGKQSVVIPDVAYYDWREASSLLTSLGLDVKKVYITHDTIISNYAIKTDPVKDSIVETGDTVKLYISQGQEVETVTVPSLYGMSRADASREITEYHLTLGEVTTKVVHDTALDGKVVSQSVAANTTATAWSTVIDIVIGVYEQEGVSWGGESYIQVSVPDESQLDESQPDESQPDISQLDESQPDESQPDISQPDESQDESDVSNEASEESTSEETAEP
ncbi:MAG TPA: Stk1 family PASTA domain-containing Ser/Thr kinase [Bacillota bacterium]|nr:Stk1 family PASTA domain-containing Ser/Thr kinase [Bacillota bacterium]